MSEKKKRIMLYTPRGIAKFPFLNKTKTHVDGKPLPVPQYECELVVDPDDEKVSAFLEKLNELAEAAFNSAVNAQKPAERKKNPLKKHVPYSEELDKEGNETGMVVIRAKQPSIIKKQDGTEKEVKVVLADKAGKPLDEDVQIYGGSIVILCVSPHNFIGFGRAGVNLYLNGAQLIKASEYQSDMFGAVEDDDDDDDDADGVSFSAEDQESAENF